MLPIASFPCLPTNGRGIFRPGALVAFALTAAAPSSPGLAAQSVVDEGVFLVSRGGEAVGTEQFAIRRTSTGGDGRLIATAEIELELSSGSRRVSSALEVSQRDLRVSAYQVKVSGDAPAEIYMTLSGRRFQAKVVTSDGEQFREYRATAGAVILEEGIAHHFHFLAARVGGGESRVPVISPRAGGQRSARVSREDTERIQIAGQSVQARHLRVEMDGSRHDVWVDDQGRVLRVMDPESGYRAERRDLPR